MKKIITLIAAVMLSVTAANAQGILDGIASKVQSAAAKSSNSTISQIAGTIISKVLPTSSQIQGTWSYQKPAVMFTSNDALASLAGSVGTSTIENKMQTYLNAVGIKKGTFTMTFKSDKTFTIQMNKKTIASGTYVLNNSAIALTFKGMKTASKLTPQLDKGTLVFVMDATNLKTFMQSLGSTTAGLSTITSLLSKYNGMKVGIRLAK